MSKIAVFMVFAALLLLLGCVANAKPAPQDAKPQQGQLNSTQCDSLGGRIVNTLGESCASNESNAGEVKGLLCPCVCCIPKN